MMKGCKEIEPLLTAYLDEELDEKDYEIVKAHLDGCVDCAQKLETEGAIKKMIRERYRLEVTPVHLRARIHRLISQGETKPGFFALIADAFALHKLKGGFAFAVLLFFVAYPYFRGMMPAIGTSPNYASHQSEKPQEMEFVGEVLCVDCEILKNAHLKYQHEPDHRLGLKTKDGHIWNFIPLGEGKKLLHNDRLMHKQLKIEGFSYPGGSYIEVKKFQRI